jgi:two-component system sensor histidine kinase DesK
MIDETRTPACDERAARQRAAFQRRWMFFAGIWLVYLIQPLVTLWSNHDAGGQQVVGVVLLVVFGFTYVAVLPFAAFGGSGSRRIAALTVMVGTAVLFIVLCGDGIAFAPYLVVSLVLLLPLPLAVVPSLALCATVTFLPQHVASWHLHGIQWGIGVGTLFAGVIIGGLRIFFGTNNRLQQAEEELEQLGAEQERLRIARDLHDLLGHALTTVTLKAELASRLVGRDPERAALEMAEVAELGRQSLADVRATVSGYREVSLVRELAAAREILEAAGIEAELPAAAEDVPGDLRELFGWVVREGVTNAIRHSRARLVAVRLAGRAIEVENDGVELDPSTTRMSATGHGLTGLSERAAMLGGSLQAGRHGVHGYRLRVEVPA